MTDVPSLQQIDVPDASWITRVWNSLSWLHRVLAGLMLLRLLIALLIMLNFLPLPAEMRFGWHLYHGGDHNIMFSLARSILAGNPAREVVGLGQPLVMMPFILLLRPYYYTDMVIPLVLINGFLLGSLSVLFIGTLVKHTTDSDHIAVWAAGFWAALPLLAYLAFFWNLTLRGVFVPMLGWLNGLSDAPAAFFILLAATLLARYRNTQPTYWQMFVLGMVLCAAITFRVHIIFMVIMMLLYVLIQHGWRGLLTGILGGLIAYIPQGWYNYEVFGLVFTTGYLSIYRLNIQTGEPRALSELLPTLPFSPQNILYLFNSLFAERLWLLIPVIVAAVSLIVVAVMLWKRHGWQSLWLLAVVPMSYLMPMSLAWPFREDPVRFTIPTMPFLIVLGIYAVHLITQNSKLKTIFRES